MRRAAATFPRLCKPCLGITSEKGTQAGHKVARPPQSASQQNCTSSTTAIRDTDSQPKIISCRTITKQLSVVADRYSSVLQQRGRRDK